MRTAVLGTGVVARTVGAALVRLGDEVTLGTRDVEVTLARTDTDVMGSPRSHAGGAPGSLADGGTSVFVSGDDPGAKHIVTDLLHRFGWRDVIDLGDLSTARGTEMLLPVWVRLWQALGTAHFNVAVVR